MIVVGIDTFFSLSWLLLIGNQLFRKELGKFVELKNSIEKKRNNGSGFTIVEIFSSRRWQHTEKKAKISSCFKGNTLNR